MVKALNLIGTVNTPYLPVTGSQRLVYLLLEVDECGAGAHCAERTASVLPGEREFTRERSSPLHREDGSALLPVNLVLIVDVSESMHVRVATEAQFEELARTGALQEVLVDGVPAWQPVDVPEELLFRLPRKIDRVRDALQAVIEQLRPDDRFALVAFAGRAVTLIPNALVTDSIKHRLFDVVGGLDGLQLGDDTYIGQGLALGFEELHRGTSAGLGERADTGHPPQREEKQSHREARPYLADRLFVLTDGFTLDERECRAWARQAQKARVPISTMGLGGEFNEELMIPIADQTGGEAYLLEDPEDISPAFAQELHRAQAVRYRNLELKLRFPRGVEVRAAYRVRPSIAPLDSVNEENSYSFALGDLVAGESPALLLELIVPPRSVGVYRLAQALLACDDPAGGLAGLKTRSDVVVEYTTDPDQVSRRVARVMHVIEALSAYKLQRRAQDDLAAGDVEGATRKLRTAATRLLDMGNETLAAEMEREAENLERRGRADPMRTKKLRYETRKLTQGLEE